MKTRDNPPQVYAAAIANLVIAVSKFAAAAITGSSAMLSEGIHSAADTANEFLLLRGIKRGRKPADEAHPFGYGQEIYFWGFIVAMVLFSIGGGISIYEGIDRLRQPHEISNPMWSYVVLAIAAVAESISFSVAFREFRKSIRKGETRWQAFRTSKDPSVFIILAEDASALAGLLVAAAGLILGQITQSSAPDAVAAIVIGLILAGVALLMGSK